MTRDEPYPTRDWQQRLALIVETMREMSRHTDPQAMVRAYGERMQQLMSIDRRLSLSRRGLEHPWYRITRSTTWKDEVNPWEQKDRLPLLKGGLLAELIYGSVPRVFDELEAAADDPAAEYLAGMRSLLAIPMFDQGESLNMVVVMQQAPAAFPKEEIPDVVWRTNLFGRATSNLVLQHELHRAYEALDRELKVVGDIQRSLLPAELPNIPTMDLAAHYQPAQRAGGDYYDFFPLPEGKWGIFIADVSGHGTPAAVLMAVTHCIAHTHPGIPAPPGKILEYLNLHLATRYVSERETFVTAFYGVYDPARRSLTYACAGHNPPRVKRGPNQPPIPLDCVGGLPLGVLAEVRYADAEQKLQPGDQLVFYTDGITETRNAVGELFGVERLDAELKNCAVPANTLLESVLRAVDEFAAGHPADDDRTLIAARML